MVVSLCNIDLERSASKFASKLFPITNRSKNFSLFLDRLNIFNAKVSIVLYSLRIFPVQKVVRVYEDDDTIRDKHEINRE